MFPPSVAVWLSDLVGDLVDVGLQRKDALRESRPAEGPARARVGVRRSAGRPHGRYDVPGPACRSHTARRRTLAITSPTAGSDWARPSTVSTSAPHPTTAGRRHDMGLESTSTVQARHSPTPQPILVPVNPIAVDRELHRHSPVAMNAWPSCSSPSSSPGRPMIWMPTGKPSDRPTGTASTGTP